MVQVLPNKVIANTCLFILTSFSKQSASWKVLEICELCALSTDSRKTYSVNKYMYTGSSSYSFDWGGNNPLGGEETEKTRLISLDDPPEISCKDLARIACNRQYLQESYKNGVILQVPKSLAGFLKESCKETSDLLSRNFFEEK